MGFAAQLADRIDPPDNPYTSDPVGWVEDRLGETAWSKQREILESIVANRRTVVHSCNSGGKSFIAARAAAWWVDTRPPGKALVVSTAASWEQVRTVLWQELGAAHRKGRLAGRVNQTEWWIGDEIVGYGRKPPDTDATGFFGAHRPDGVLVIIDEASGITEVMWEAVGRILTGENDRVLAIGNPDYEGSPFAQRCSSGSGWNVVHIDAFDTPNFTGEPVPPGSSLITQTSIDETVKDYGDDSPQYLSKVRGVFPPDSAVGVIAWSALRACIGVAATEKAGPLREPVEIGVDVAAGGEDLTVIFPRFGPRAGVPLRLNTDDSEEITDAVIDMIRETEATAVKVDWNGVGFGVYGSLCRRVGYLDWPVDVHKVVFGGGANDPVHFVNQRAELWWMGRELARAGDWDLSDCDERSTLADLASARWFETRQHRIQIEDKNEIRKRLGRSPDDGDALLMAFYTPPVDDVPADSAPYRDRRLDGRR